MKVLREEPILEIEKRKVYYVSSKSKKKEKICG
jgi:hypothetical protein